eukprot:gene21141-23219_t
MERCVICQQDILDKSKASALRTKGCDGLIRASQERGTSIDVRVGDYVHQECRKQYTNVNVIKKDLKEQGPDPNQPRNTQRLRSGVQQFSFANNCLFCGKEAKFEDKKRGIDVFPVRTIDFEEKILEVCSTRKVAWAEKVEERIRSCSDLHAADAIYHQQCNVNFRTRRDIPRTYQSEEQSTSKKMKGRPLDARKEEAFLNVASYLSENDDEQITVADLVLKMKEYMGEESYSAKHMKKRILEHFRDEITITNINGRSDVVTFRTTAALILHQFHSLPKINDPEADKAHIIKAAAKLIKNDIKLRETSKSHYPPIDDISSVDNNLDFVPCSLQILLKNIFVEEKPNRKVASIGQAIMQAARPKVLMAPLQLGLGVQMHHHFGSKFLVESLHAHGFCVSYSEVKRFESSAAALQQNDVFGLASGCFTQFVADNVDHNTRTLDGTSTFHGMGMIAVATPKISGHKVIPRVKITSLLDL